MKIGYHGRPVACLCAVSFLLCCGATAQARQNIFIGKMSVRYDHQERTYDSGGSTVIVPDGEGGEIVAAPVTEPDAGASVIAVEDRRGDRQRYVVAPRFTFSSTDIKDFVEFTYAPGLNYDELDDTTDLDHDFRLKGERKLTQNWQVSLGNRFFLGDDPYLQEQLSSAVIAPEAVEPVAGEQDVEESGPEMYEESITERYGRRRFWTNALDLNTGYAYGEGRRVTAGYSFNVLRNDDSERAGGYTDYDRHIGRLGVNHRINQRWSAGGSLNYNTGLFDAPDIIVVSPEADGTTEVQSVITDASDDLSTYTVSVRGGYDVSPRLNLFTEYSYLNTDYDAAVRNDYQVNNVAIGVTYDVAEHWSFSMGGGPSWGSFENTPTENDYNAHAALNWQYERGSMSFFGEKGYDQSNFDGRRSGLTDFWRTGVSMNYQLTQDLKATFSAAYRDNRRLQYPAPQTLVIVDTGDPLQDPDDLNEVKYTEKDYDAGLSLAYSFMRWYSLSGGYRYYDHDNDLSSSGSGAYDEHRFFIHLSAASEIFRW